MDTARTTQQESNVGAFARHIEQAETIMFELAQLLDDLAEAERPTWAQIGSMNHLVARLNDARDIADALVRHDVIPAEAIGR